MSGSLRGALSVDVEEYFHAWALSTVIQPDDWSGCPSRVEYAMHRVLDLFATTGVTATCFVLGWVAERRPALVRAIVEAGHELASHGYGHAKVSEQPRDAFRDDVHRARGVLEDIGGVPVSGYRAPSFSIGAEQWWAFSILAEAGYRYSSSLNPIHHDHYGMPDAPRHPVPAHRGGPDRGAGRHRRYWLAHALRRRRLFSGSCPTRSAAFCSTA